MLSNKDPFMPPTYEPKELQEGWEFKIITSGTAAFRKADVMRKVIEEESLAGWQLVEKLDDHRIRLKRHESAKAEDARLPFDAYRTTYEGEARLRLVVFWLVIIIGAVVLYFLLTQRS